MLRMRGKEWCGVVVEEDGGVVLVYVESEDVVVVEKER